MFCPGCRSQVEDGARFCPECGVKLANATARMQRDSVFEMGEWGQVAVNERLGEGLAGAVHRGWLTYSGTGRFAGTPGHPVAVKLLQNVRLAPEAEELLVREALAVERLAHPNIVSTIGVLKINSQLALVMECVAGEALTRVLWQANQRRVPGTPCLPIALGCHYFCGMLGALAASHAIGILHTSLRPANLLVRADGVLKLGDFGESRWLNTLSLPSGASSSPAMLSRLAYLSPEQLRGGSIDARSDLYSATMVFYEMLAGTTPFAAFSNDPERLRQAQLDEAPAALSAHLAGVPSELDAVLAHALAKNPALRYPSAVELGEAVFRSLRRYDTPAWSAQRAFASMALTLSAAMPQVDPQLIQRAALARTAILSPFKN